MTISREKLLLRQIERVKGQLAALGEVAGETSIPIAAGALYPSFGLLLSPVLSATAMSLSSVLVIGNALRLKLTRL